MASGTTPESEAQTFRPSPNYFYQHGHRLQENGYRVVPVKAGDKYPAKCDLHVIQDPATGDTRLDPKWVGLKGWQDIENYNPDVAELWGESSVGIVTAFAINARPCW